MAQKSFLLVATLASLLAIDAAAFVRPGLLPGQGDAYGHRPTPVARETGPEKSPRVRRTAGEGAVDPVPEPATLALTALGLVALGAASRRWRVH